MPDGGIFTGFRADFHRRETRLIYQIEITATDIANGVPRSLRCCPIAQAAARSIGISPGPGNIGVDPHGILLLDSLRGLPVPASGMLPEEARDVGVSGRRLAGRAVGQGGGGRGMAGRPGGGAGGGYGPDMVINGGNEDG
jgi:hypothetical protein